MEIILTIRGTDIRIVFEDIVVINSNDDINNVDIII